MVIYKRWRTNKFDFYWVISMNELLMFHKCSALGWGNMISDLAVSFSLYLLFVTLCSFIDDIPVIVPEQWYMLNIWKRCVSQCASSYQLKSNRVNAISFQGHFITDFIVTSDGNSRGNVGHRWFGIHLAFTRIWYNIGRYEYWSS